MPLKDKVKRREHHRRYIKKKYNEDEVYREKHKANVKRNKALRKENLQKIFNKWRSVGCSVCGEMTICCIDAHHVDPLKKCFNIGTQASNGNPSVKRFMAELKKCIRLCKNCHAKFHHNERQDDSPPFSVNGGAPD